MAEMLAVQTVHVGVYGGPQGRFPNLRPYSSPKVNPVSVILKRSKYLRIAQPHFRFARIIPLIPSFYLLNPLYANPQPRRPHSGSWLYIFLKAFEQHICCLMTSASTVRLAGYRDPPSCFFRHAKIDGRQGLSTRG